MSDRSAISCAAASAGSLPAPAARWAPRPGSETAAVTDAPCPEVRVNGWEVVSGPVGPVTPAWGTTMCPSTGASRSSAAWSRGAAATHVPVEACTPVPVAASVWAARRVCARSSPASPASARAVASTGT